MSCLQILHSFINENLINVKKELKLRHRYEHSDQGREVNCFVVVVHEELIVTVDQWNEKSCGCVQQRVSKNADEVWFVLIVVNYFKREFLTFDNNDFIFICINFIYFLSFEFIIKTHLFIKGDSYFLFKSYVFVVFYLHSV